MNLEKLRKRAGLTQRKLCQHLDIAESTLRNWESGRTVPTIPITQLKALLELLNCSFDEFYLAWQSGKEKSDD